MLPEPKAREKPQACPHGAVEAPESGSAAGVTYSCAIPFSAVFFAAERSWHAAPCLIGLAMTNPTTAPMPASPKLRSP
jgi:hypothetical protein